MTATISSSLIGQQIISHLQHEFARITTDANTPNTPSTKSPMDIVTYDGNLIDTQRAQLCGDVSPRMRRLVKRIVKKFKNGPTSMIIRIVGEICTGKTTVSNQLHALLTAHNVPCTQLQEVSSPHMFTIVNKLDPVLLPKQVVIIEVGGAGRIPPSFTKAKEAAIAAATESAKASGATDDDAAKAGHDAGAAVVMFIRMRVAFPPVTTCTAAGMQPMCAFIRGLASARAASGHMNGSTAILEADIWAAAKSSVEAMCCADRQHGAAYYEQLTHDDLRFASPQDNAANDLWTKLATLLYEPLAQIVPAVNAMALREFLAFIQSGIGFTHRAGTDCYQVVPIVRGRVDKHPKENALFNNIARRSQFIVKTGEDAWHVSMGTPPFYNLSTESFRGRMTAGCRIVSSIKQNGFYGRFGFFTVAGEKCWFIATKNMFYRISSDRGHLTATQQMTTEAVLILRTINSMLVPNALSTLEATYESVTILGEQLCFGHFVSYDEAKFVSFGAYVDNSDLISPADTAVLPGLLQTLFGDTPVSPFIHIDTVADIDARNHDLVVAAGPAAMEGCVTSLVHEQNGTLVVLCNAKAKADPYKCLRELREFIVARKDDTDRPTAKLITDTQTHLIKILTHYPLAEFPHFVFDYIVLLLVFVLAHLPTESDHAFLGMISFASLGVGPVVDIVRAQLPAEDVQCLAATVVPTDSTAYVRLAYQLAQSIHPVALPADELTVAPPPENALYQAVSVPSECIDAICAKHAERISRWRETHGGATQNTTHHITTGYGLAMTAGDDGLCAKVWVLGVFGCQKTLFAAVVVCIGDRQPKLLHITLAHSGRPAAAKDELAEEYPGCIIPESFSQDVPADYTGVVEYVMGHPRQGRPQDQRPGRRQPSQRQT